MHCCAVWIRWRHGEERGDGTSTRPFASHTLRHSTVAFEVPFAYTFKYQGLLSCRPNFWIQSRQGQRRSCEGDRCRRCGCGSERRRWCIYNRRYWCRIEGGQCGGSRRRNSAVRLGMIYFWSRLMSFKTSLFTFCCPYDINGYLS